MTQLTKTAATRFSFAGFATTAALLLTVTACAIEDRSPKPLWRTVPVELHRTGTMLPTRCLPAKGTSCTYELANSIKVTPERQVLLRYHLVADSIPVGFDLMHMSSDYSERGQLDSAKNYAIWFRSNGDAGSIELRTTPPNHWLRGLTARSMIFCNNHTDHFDPDEGCLLLGPLQFGTIKRPIYVDALFILPETARDSAEKSDRDQP